MTWLKNIAEPVRRMPRAALITVGIGLLVSVMIFGLRFVDLGLSAEVDWAVTETVETPDPVGIPGGGSIDLARTSVASIAPTDRDELIFRVSGVVVASSNEGPLRVRCDIDAADPETTVARTPKKRAAWPRPSEDLAIQEVPELLVISFSADGAETLGLEVRDSVRRYTDSADLTTVIWDGFEESSQNWVWEIPKGTRGVPVTLGYAVVFKTSERPAATIDCRASIDGGREAGIEAGVLQETWPVPGETEDAA